MKIEFQDHIDDYLLGRLSEEDCKAFEEQLMKDEELFEQLKFTRDVQAAMKSRNEKLVKLRAWEKEKLKVEVVRHGNHRLLYWASGIAAVIVVGVFIVNRFFSSTSPLSHKLEYVAYSPNQRKTVDHRPYARIDETEKSLAMNNIQTMDRQILFLLKEQEMLEYRRRPDERGDNDIIDSLETIKKELDRLYYLKAQAYYELQRYDEALNSLRSICNHDSEYGIKADSLYRIMQP